MEVVAKPIGVDPDAVPVSQVRNAPVSSEKTPSQEFDLAVDSGDPKLVSQVAAVNANNPVGVAATHVADLFYKGQKAVDEMMAPIEKAGGVGTPKGNLEVAKQAQTYFKQEDPKYFDAFIHALTGNKAMAQNMITGGDVKYKTVYDLRGKQYQVGVNALGKIIDVEDMNGRKISRQEYDGLNIGLESYQNTLDYLQAKQTNEDNTKEWQAKIKRDANAEATYNGVIAPLAARTYDDLEFVKKLDISAEQRANLYRFVNSSMSASSKRSQTEEMLNQMQGRASINAGKDLSDQEAASVGLPANLFSYGGKGIINKKTGESYSFDELRQRNSTQSKSDEIDSKFTQDKKSFAEYLLTTGLDEVSQKRILRIFDSSKEIGKSLLKLEQEGAPRYLFTPNTSDALDPFGIIQGKNIQLLANQKLLQLNREFSRGAYQAGQRKGAILSNPAEVDAAFTRSDEFKNVINQGLQLTTQTLERHAAEPKRTPKVQSPIAPTEKSVQGGVGVTPPSTEVGSSGVAAVEERKKRLEQQGAPTIDELPPQFKPAGFASDGEPLFTVDGKSKMRKSDILKKLGR